MNTKTASRSNKTIISLKPKAGWDNYYNSNDNNSGLKMKFPRRNSLTFPLPKPSIPDNYDPDCGDLPEKYPQRSKCDADPSLMLSRKLDRALTILDDDNDSNDSTDGTCKTMSISESTFDDEVLRVSEHSKATSAIATPVTSRKPLQIPAAKRKELALLGVVSPTSVVEGNLASFIHKTKKKEIAPAFVAKPKYSCPEPSRSKKKNRKPRKRVHFRQTCTMRRTLSRKDMTPKEIRRAWLSSEEYNRMQLRDEILADRFDSGKCKPGTCTRGLESKIEVTALKKLSLRLTGIEEVLMEQDRQWDEAGDDEHFFYDFGSFAYVYSPTSEEATTRALQLAYHDREEAEKILASQGMFKAKGAAAFVSRTRSRFTRRRSWA